jgi:tetratricopeptide (TPR) repeat protein
MDIWEWVGKRCGDLMEAGQGRMADLIEAIPEDVNEDRVQRVQAYFPEALAGARALEDPWLEVYFRHWGLQNRLNNLAEGESALAEATALLEFAHREDTRDCPQSVCATEDVSTAYGNADGPGYAEDRKEVVIEILARIDPTWQCFHCMSLEYASALEDEKRYEEAFSYLERQAETMEAAGGEVESRFRWDQAALLTYCGRAEEALRRFDELDALGDPTVEQDRIDRAINRAYALVSLGRIDEAHEVLPKWKDLTPSDYSGWTRAMKRIADARPELNTWQVGGAFQAALDYLVKVSSFRNALDVALRHGELAIARGARMTATRALGTARSLIPKLHVPLDAPERVQALADAIDAMPELAPLPVPSSELLAYIRATESEDVEQHAEWLVSASSERPDDIELHLVTGNVLAALTRKDQAIDFLFRDLESHPAERQLVNAILGLANEGGGDEVYSRLVALVEPRDAVQGHLVRGVWAYARENWTEATAQAETVLELNPDCVDALHLAGGAAFKARDFARATSFWMRSLDAEGGELKPNEGWNLLAAASACGEWSVVREVAKKKGMTLEGENGVVEEVWGGCAILFDEEGEERRYGALRTGPVTARIVQPSWTGLAQHAGDWVVFDAIPVDPPPEDEKEREDFWYTYRVVQVLSEGEFGETWLLDGASPSDDQWAQLRDGVREKGWACWSITPPDYTVTDPSGSDEGLPGILIDLAAPKPVSPATICEVLDEMTASWKHPLSWLALARAARKDVRKHKSIVDRYGL